MTEELERSAPLLGVDGGLRAKTARKPRAKQNSHSPRWVSAASVFIVVAVWWLIASRGWVPDITLPAPRSVVEALHRLLRQGYMDSSLGEHLSASLGRIALALLASSLTATVLGVLMGLIGWLRAMIDPLIELYRPVPPLAYLPLMVIWFGIGETSKVVLIFLAMFAPMLIATVGAVQRVDRTRLLAVRCLGASPWQLIWNVVLPSALPEMLTGLRIALGVGWSTLVAAELVAASRGLGFLVQSSSQFLATDTVLAGILLIALLALGCELVLRALQHRFASWN